MLFLASHGYRCIAHDRRGHGRSGQPWNGNDLDTYADDLAELTTALDLRDAIHVGHSTGGGEVARYIGRHGTKRVTKAVLISAIPPLMLKTPGNPGGLPIEAFDKLGADTWAQRARGELAAAGQAAARARAPGVLARLTPQEYQIVTLAARGLSNREIAAQLFLSHRTVGYHLYKAYPKLDICSRAQLASLIAEQPPAGQAPR